MVKKKDLLRENSELMQKVEFLQAQLEEKNIIIAELEKKHSFNQIFGEKTTLASYVSTIFHYIKFKEQEKARLLLDILFKDSTEGELRFFKFEDRYLKEFFSPNPDIQLEGACLKEVWRFAKYKEKSKAVLTSRIHQVIDSEKKQKQVLINIPETIIISEYVLVKEIIGPDLFDFYNQLVRVTMDSSCTVAKDALLDALLDEQMRYNAFIRTREYNFPQDQLIIPDYAEKMLEFYRLNHIKLSPSPKEKIIKITKQLSKNAKYAVRDGIPEHYRLHARTAETLLSQEFLQQENCSGADMDIDIYRGIYREVKKMLATDFFSYDHDDLVKRSFQSEDAILSLECYAPSIGFEQRIKHEKRYVEMLREQGENVENYWDMRGIEGWLKHCRWALVRQFNPKYPDTETREYWQHHINMAHSSLFQHIFKRQPLPHEIQGITPEKTLAELVMHPDCRA